MKIHNIKIYQNNKPRFTANNSNLTKTKEVVSEYVVKHFGLNMETMVGYKGKKIIMPPPENINPSLARVINKLQIDWSTHVKSKT